MYLGYLVKVFNLSLLCYKVVQKWIISHPRNLTFPKKPEVVIEYNNKSYESFIDNGFEAYIPRSVYGPRDRMLTWLNKVDLRKGPLERTVRSIVRLKAIDYNSPKHERKEFVYYEEDWTANDWLGIPIDPYGGHIEGRFSEALYSRKLDERTGEFIGNHIHRNQGQILHTLVKEER